MSSKSERVLDKVIERLNNEAEYRNQFFSNPADFIRKEVPGMTLTPQLQSEFDAYIKALKDKFVGTKITFTAGSYEAPFIKINTEIYL